MGQSRSAVEGDMALAVWQIPVGLAILLLGFRVPTSFAQPGFLSIDCGSTTNATDPNTGIQWVTDSPYITTGLNSDNVTLGSLYTGNSELQTLRYFPVPRSKYCYILPAMMNGTYLVRTTFLYGSYDGGLSPPKFKLSIDTEIIGSILPSTAETFSTIYETTMMATADNIYVCLEPMTPGVDVPFINTLELRSLGVRKLYPMVNQGFYLYTKYRYNFGYNSLLRYKADPYDRLWFGYGTDPPTQVITTTQAVRYGNASRDQAPLEVLQTAQTWNKTENFTFQFNVSGGQNYEVFLWFAEIDPRAATLVRQLEVNIDGIVQDPINIVNETGAMYTAFEWGYSNVNLSSSSVMTFAATPASDLGPLLNGMEVYLISPAIVPRTYEPDAAAILSIVTGLNISDWTGDPCLPVPFDWITCSPSSAGPSPRVTSLKLASFNLTGPIPPAIAELTSLTILWLENNALSGTIPNLSALTQLTQLHLQNNLISGPFPTWFTSLTGLQELYVYGNNLTGEVPSSLLNKPGLDFQFTPGNKGLCSNTTSCVVPSPITSSKKSNISLIVGCAVGGVVVASVVLFFIVYFACCHNRRNEPVDSTSKLILPLATHKRKESGTGFGTSGARNQAKPYTLNEVKATTNNFNNKIGEGGFGPVYWGTLPDGKEVAVKRCWASNQHGVAQFVNEVELLSRVHHRNLATLIGYCEEGGEQILLYEYMPNGDLRQHLYGHVNNSGTPKAPLPWRKRLEIALDSAQGLDYLHTGCSPSIIHRDVKTSNILLANKMVAKVADFGLSKLTDNEAMSYVSTDVKGTAGYLAPEYLTSRRLTDKSDVYSFGVVLLELITGREPIDRSRLFDKHPTVLVDWVRPHLEAGNVKDIVDPSLGDSYNLECLWKVAEIGMLCVEPRSFNRPSMTDVVRELRDAILLEDEQTEGDFSTGRISSGPYLAGQIPNNKQPHYTQSLDVSQKNSEADLSLDPIGPR